MPWEQDEHVLTEAELKAQLARILATGALQAARKHSAGARRRGHGGEEDREA